MRGSSLGTLVQQLRLELRRSSSVAINQDDLPHLREVLARNYEFLYDEHDWPQLRRVFPRVTLSAGQKLYDFPTGLNPERVENVRLWYNGLPHPVHRGIDIEEMASYDSVEDERSAPVLRWDIRWDGDDASGTTQYEVWPIPASSDQEIEFTGIQSVKRLTADADLCHLDDRMIVLFSAAQLLSAQKAEDAGIVAEQANARFEQMKKRITGAGRRVVRMGLGQIDEPMRHRAVIRVSG